MAVKLQTFRDIRNFLFSELSEQYDESEILSLTKQIISAVFQTDTVMYLLNENKLIEDNKKKETIIRYCRELRSGMPIQYITGETIFFNCKIKVNRNVLIPRPETEELVELIIRETSEFRGSIIDIGTGSGCIAIALALNLPSAKVTAIDISTAALDIARQNAAANYADVYFIVADIFNTEPDRLATSDMIVSNPPYIRMCEKKYMKNRILEHEPGEALFVNDEDPLVFYKKILELSMYILNPGGIVYFEINEVMGKQMYTLLKSYNYQNIRIIKDINGKDRIASGERKR